MHNKTWPINGFPFDRDIFDPDTVNLMGRADGSSVEGRNRKIALHKESSRRYAPAFSDAGRIMGAAATGERDLETLTRAALQGPRGGAE
jgi:hypothetical protein